MNRYNFTNAVTLWKNGLLEKQPNSKYWIVKKSFYFYIDYENKSAKYVLYDWYMIKNKIVVPVWFQTDFASSPRLFWLISPPTKYISTIMHDYAYARKLYNRDVCDEIFLNALLVEWCNKFIANLYYIWVRLWWWWWYYKLKEKLINSLMGKFPKGKK
jgi:hypothetical protein